MFDIDPTKSIDKLLLDIRSGAVMSLNNRGLGAGPVLPPFAALLVRLSKDAAETADKNIRIQQRLIWLTVAALVVSILTLGAAFFQYR